MQPHKNSEMPRYWDAGLPAHGSKSMEAANRLVQTGTSDCGLTVPILQSRTLKALLQDVYCYRLTI
jgi:hypothetical protein